MAQRAAVLAALDPQFTLRRPVPEKGCVRRDHRPHYRAGAGTGCRRHRPLPLFAGRGRPELEYPEIHRGDRLAGAVPGVPGGEEPAFAECGAFGSGQVGEADPERELLAVPQIAVVDLIAV